MQKFAARLAELSSLWNRIELRAKQAEQWRGEAIVASINEMRYAGRRIVDAIALAENNLDGSQDPKIEEHLIIAKSYLLNADHDITDSVSFIVLRRVSKTIDQHGLQKIEQYCPKFAEDYLLVKEANQLVLQSREERAKRIEAYNKLADEYLPRLMDLYKRLVDSRELALTEPVSRELRNLRRKVYWTRIFAFSGSAASIVSLILGLLFWIYPWTEFKSRVMPAPSVQVPVGTR
jgi:hypothetical protein